ncbi:hypothetical protein J7M31_00640 [Bifidobacterium longum]|nr:hypothetical protein [Bifidobacterium longum]QTL68760.1 hypothetical protein J7M31_00640 [Bifidobacterium longum]
MTTAKPGTTGSASLLLRHLPRSTEPDRRYESHKRASLPAVIEPPLPAETARPPTEGRRGEPRAQPTRVHRIRASGVPFQRPDGLAVLAYGGFHITGPVKRADHLARDMANRRLTHGKLLRSNQMGQDEHNPER